MDVENIDTGKLIEKLKKAKDVIELWIPMFEQYDSPATIDYAIEVITEQQKLIDKLYEAMEFY